MKFSDLSIGTKLKTGFGGIVGLLVVLIGIAYLNFAKLSEANQWNVHTYQVMGETKAMLESLINIETGERGFALTGKENSLEPYHGGKAAFKEHWEKTKALTADNATQQERLRKLSQEYTQWLQDGIDSVIKLRKETADDNMAAVVAAEQSGKGKKGMDSMRALLTEINNAEEALLTKRAEEAEALKHQTNAVLLGGGTITMVLAALLALWLSRLITKPLTEAVSIAQQVARGDLTRQIEVNSRDETGTLLQALREMNESLVRIVSEVRGGTETITSAATQIASGNQDLSSRTEQQAGSLEETASSMEELTSTVKQNADNARQANQLAQTASDVAQQGGAVVSQVVVTMGSINESARKIVDIIGVIDGIAFQTNILALNAAVEAARAGEQGRGFAVVASEVRNLAQRSAAAAKEIKSLIGDSVDKVEAGSRLVDEAGKTMNEVVASVKRVSDIVSEIAAASDEQRAGIEQVNQAVTQMDQVTQQNAALVEEAAAAAEAMKDQATSLTQVVSVFRMEARAYAAPAAAMNVPARASLAPAPAKRVVRTGATSPVVRSARPAAPLAKVDKSDPAADQWEEF